MGLSSASAGKGHAPSAHGGRGKSVNKANGKWNESGRVSGQITGRKGIQNEWGRFVGTGPAHQKGSSSVAEPPERPNSGYVSVSTCVPAPVAPPRSTRPESSTTRSVPFTKVVELLRSWTR